MSASRPDDVLAGLFGRGWHDDGWLQPMLDAEAALARAAERAGLAPAGSGAAVTAAARAERFDAAELASQATGTGNPVPALVRALTAAVPPDAALAVHPGATSQDIIDTAMMLMAAAATGRTLADLASAAAAAASLARQHEQTILAGRTLLQQAVPVTFGLVAANWLAGIDRARTTLGLLARDRIACQLGGAAGTLASLDPAGPRLVALFAAETGLAAPDLPWHTERLRVVELAAALAGVGAALSKIARDVTLLAQTEVGELAEGDPNAGGSSAMPHKRNPIAAVVVLGCTKRLPGLFATIAAAAEQEHQRAAGAWHAEWETLTDMLRLTSSATAWSAQLLTGLQVDTGRMRANLDAAGGLPLAEHVSALLAPHVGRLRAHDLVARASRQVAAGDGSLAEALLRDTEGQASLALAGLTGDALRAALDPAGYLGATGAFIAAALAAHEAASREIG